MSYYIILHHKPYDLIRQSHINMTQVQNTSEMLTTIKLDSDTRDQLMDLGKKGESYDTILKRLIAHYKEHPPKE